MHNTLQKHCFIIIFTLFLAASLIQNCSFNKPSSPKLVPKISIIHNSAEIESGQSVELISYSGNPMDIPFTIGNKGLDYLNLTEPAIEISGSSAFSISKEPALSVAPEQRTDFAIQFSSTEKINFAKITIASNDPDVPCFEYNICCEKSNIQVYFTGPSCDLSLKEAIIEKITNHTGQEYMDLCLYGLNSEDIIKAIENAISRGVHVRFVGDLDGSETLENQEGTYYPAYYRIASALDTYFPVNGKNRTNFPDHGDFDDFNLRNDNIMHNKFALFTDNSGNKYLLTGSTNATKSGFKLNNNNSIIIQDPEIVDTYREQFEYLLDLPGREPVDEVRHHIVDGITIDVLFPPLTIDGKTPIEHLMNTTGSAKSNILFMIFSFTHRDLINSLISMHEKGIIIKGIFDESQLGYSSEELLTRKGIPCIIDGNYSEEFGHGGKLHHKTMIIDDTVVITGSFNWSYNANENNDENLIIFHSKEISRLYKDEWAKRRNEGKEIGQDTNENNMEYDCGDYQDLVINEVMWMGSRKTEEQTFWNDEFIELRNLTDREINLNGWYFEGAASSGKILFLENISIEPYGYAVIMHRSIPESAFQPENYLVDSNLSISNQNLAIILKDPNDNTIDKAGNNLAGEDFSGYSGILKKSMSRIDTPGEGDEPDNWFTTNTQVNISEDNYYSLYNLATPGADNMQGDLYHDGLSLVISEIAWAGTDISHYDEWFELYNNTDEDINLAGWSIIGSLEIELYGVIPAYKHFLLERTDDDSVPDKPADILYTGGLNNSGAIIRLLYNNREIDCVDMQEGWAAGSNDPKISMERVDTYAPGYSSNWQDGPGDIEGAQNSNE